MKTNWIKNDDLFFESRSGSPRSHKPIKETPALRVWNAVLRFVRGLVPVGGDSVLEVVRKCVFFAALTTLVTSLSYIAYDMMLLPFETQRIYSGVEALYDPNNPVAPPADFAGEYPEGIQDSFKAIYAENQDIRGWLTYRDTSKSWLEINYPVMYSGDNDYYLRRSFYGVKNKNGVPFFDMHNDLSSYQSTNKVTIIYGHNMSTGYMFSPLNKLLNNRNLARTAPVINMNTIYRNGEYKVFAIIMANTDQRDGPPFYYLQTQFSSDKSFMDYVANIRARSVFDYNGVDVQPEDELLILSTCTTKSNAKFDDGRCVVVARRVREGESSASNPADIVENADAIMPLAWYTNQNKTPHPFYVDGSGYVIPGLWTNDGTGTTTPQNTSSGQNTITTGDVPAGVSVTEPFETTSVGNTTQGQTGSTTTQSGSGGTTTSGAGTQDKTTTSTAAGGNTTTSKGNDTTKDPATTVTAKTTSEPESTTTQDPEPEE